MMMDQFQNKHAMANNISQLQPQKLSSNVWIGPLNSVAQNVFLSQNNIKYIIGIMPSQKCVYYLKSFSNDTSCCVSFDPNFNIQKLTEDEGELIMKFNSKFSNNLSYITDNKLSNSIITNIDFQKMLSDYLTLIHSIQEKDPQCGILLFSLNGNDNVLSTFAMAGIIDQHNCDISSAFSYLRSIRPSVAPIDEFGYYAHELMKFQLNNKALKQFGGDDGSTPTKIKRDARDALGEEGDIHHHSPRNVKRTIL
ncbi:hypothetical protein BN7_79 [Wickerhamomyces ciferrii]|uniref:Uncharacterized protein n=1 Tax=Wickerhamomyces ciferrii (strain ATCC 14091 / BCRC 22168 / CBS 111 / JCM 3599 / NBRC 0793 / NRRL Y-1031 F-60-10) TaxID=1206466 RepID=K0KCC2_WICCF|nr:uncharacterized protein BN7_79 [Wickerhamomyces ciferrii]CCH40546.1 hypothetical protein BN7_79 [Wickerhamomyces ciferrii]